MLAENRGGIVIRAQVAEAFVLCIRGGGYFLLAHERGGSFFPSEKGILCVHRVRRNDRGWGIRGTALRNTNDCRLRSKCGPRPGEHTSLGRIRKGCICLLARIVMTGKDRVSMATRGA